MKDPNILFEDITEQLTSSGQLFETREYKNSKGIALKEYASFPDNLRGYFDFGLLHADKEFLIYDSERFLYKDVIAKAAQVGNALISEGIEKYLDDKTDDDLRSKTSSEIKYSLSLLIEDFGDIPISSINNSLDSSKSSTSKP